MKLKILVGSKAAKTHISSFRDGSDTDVFSTHKQAGLDGGDWGIISAIINEELEGEDHTLVLL